MSGRFEVANTKRPNEIGRIGAVLNEANDVMLSQTFSNRWLRILLCHGLENLRQLRRETVVIGRSLWLVIFVNSITTFNQNGVEKIYKIGSQALTVNAERLTAG
jgi:hypothetical protein